jgi:hypothetical protein
MNHDHDLLTLSTTFLVLSLFAVGGALSPWRPSTG